MAYHDAERNLRIGETDTVGFTFSGSDLPDGVTVTGGSVAVSPATGLTLGSSVALITADADGAYAWATAVTAGEYYVTFTIPFSDGKTLKRVWRVFVPTEGMSGANIVTIDEAKAHMGSSGVVPDQASVETAIETVSRRFASFFGMTSLRKTTYTSVALDGTGERYLYLPAYPVVSITSIYEDGVLLVENTDFYVDYEAGIVERAGTLLTGYEETTGYGKWLDKRKAVVVTYVAGYDISGTVTLPWDIKAAALNEAARMAIAIKNSMFGETSRSLEGATISFETGEFLPDTLATLKRYRRYAL
jgi:hypothetical protein